MVFGLVLGAASIPLSGGAIVTPTVTGVGKGVGSASGDKSKDEEMAKNCKLKIFCEADSPCAKALHGRYVGLVDERVIVQTAHAPPSHPFTGFYISYPSSPTPPTPLGLVTMIATSPPAMGWLYADRHTFQLKYGNRTASIDHVFGPWDICDDMLGVMLEEKEAFVAIEIENGIWTLFYDREGDGSGLPTDKIRLEVSLEREVVEAER